MVYGLYVCALPATFHVTVPSSMYMKVHVAAESVHDQFLLFT